MNFLVQAYYDEPEKILGVWDSIESLCSDLHKLKDLYDIDLIDNIVEFNPNAWSSLHIFAYTGASVEFEYIHDIDCNSYCISSPKDIKDKFNESIRIDELKETLKAFMGPKD
ncbi:hypothetical protein Pm5461_222 [Proteus phage vB_PmiM_Pm5461]|uniref:Uncharacterized protein n=1 Tax=Proteus phage vB_PmiM_Pm5461 TaxID=1636250 RepID=A0A0G2SSC3_9CAUD|nr:hypothetical protein AVT59_gp149 [Proteus phage vB_PmiM_Pm5461]AKA62088.1 hypothetical protein Pm5461_222 [Proteus phage vB_PmiM_Pm5461]